MEPNDKNKTTPQETLNFIPDRAAENDEFGSHKPLADVIANIIRNNDDLKVIGLLGPWGSGKTTVVKFISNELTGGNDEIRVLCFTYDAWLHQNDPPRRSFLDALIRFLIAEGLASKRDWKDQLARLNRQIEDTDVTTTPTLSEAGKWLLPLALIVPFGMQFLGHEWFDAVTAADSGWLERLGFPLGLVFTLAPVFGAIALWLLWREDRSFWTLRFWRNPKTRRRKYRDESLFSVFTNREIVKQQNRTVRTPDPTTIEFQNVFREILKEVASDRSGRPIRLIFVIDNLDRLPESQAVDMWGTIRSFFLGPEVGLRAPTVILPIDEAAVRRMYAAQHSEPHIAEALARSFMDKTFDLSFRVTRPVLSDWHRYIEKNLSYLFGDSYQPEWAHIVASLYDAWLINTGSRDPVTPRQINAMLNDIGVLWLQWRGRGISFPAIAFYAMDRDAIDRDILEYVTRGSNLLAPYDPNWQRAFAAMHFGVDVESASQILLDRPIRAAISAGKERDFLALSKSPGFSIAVRRMLERELTSNNSTVPVSRAVAFFDRIDTLDPAEQRLVWWLLRRLRLLRFEGKSVTSADANSFDILLRGLPGEINAAFIEQTASAFGRLEDTALASAEGREAAKHILSSLSHAAATHSARLPEISIKTSAASYLFLLASVGGDSKLCKALKSTASDDELQKVVVTTIESGATSPAADHMVSGLLASERVFDWVAVTDAAYAQMAAPYSPSTGIAARVLGTLRQTEIHAQQRLDEIVASGHAMARFNEAYSAKADNAAAAIASLILISETPSNLVGPDGLKWSAITEALPKLASELGLHLVAFGARSLLDFAAIIDRAPKVEVLIRASARDVLAKGLLTLPSPAEIAASYSSVYNAVPVEFDAVIIAEAAQSDDFWEALQKTEFGDIGVVLEVLLAGESDIAERAALLAKGRLDSLAVSDWAAAIDDGEFPFDLAVGAVRGLGSKRLGGHLAEALQQRFSGLLKNDSAARKRWFDLLRLTSANAQKTMLRSLRDYLATHSGGQAIPDLLFADDYALISKGELEKSADGIARNLIIPMVSEAEDLVRLQGIAERLGPVMQRAEEETRGVILERLEIHSQSPDLRDAAEALRAAWALPTFAPVADAEMALEDDDTDKSVDEP
ncbi:P-loop NTPase fold protein [Phenylobacterium sp.]|uniref:P-loop NTPase fold protein n=1 Tax=Phenylobacterium sp. TaxID=1871053 RepID=UPI00260E3D53|nr:P-loop NTPase fold protein [Phenylobacterium sp.]